MTDRSWFDLLGTADLDALRSARVGRLATLGNSGFPSVVPICFALMGGPAPTIVSVLDDKPKGVPDEDLGRVRNILRHSQVGLTIDHYEEDWTKLFYIQIRGIARMVAPDDAIHDACIALLRSKYPQYAAMDLERRSAIAIESLRVRVWRADRASLDDSLNGIANHSTAKDQPG